MILATIIGNLGRDAEIKTINDKQYLSFSVASTEKRNNEEQTTWVGILYPYQESLVPYLKKGQQVFVSGRLKAGIYQNQQSFGIDLSVFAQTLQLCGGKREESQQAQEPQQLQTKTAMPAMPPYIPLQNPESPAFQEQNDGLPF